MQYGHTALALAARNGHVNVVQCLVEAGANLEAVNNVSYFEDCWNMCVDIVSSSYILWLTVLWWSGGTIRDRSGKAASDCSGGSGVRSAQHSICAQVIARSSVNKTQCVARRIYCSQFSTIHSSIHPFTCLYVCVSRVFIRRSFEVHWTALCDIPSRSVLEYVCPMCFLRRSCPHLLE
jgi:hypothetical protein